MVTKFVRIPPRTGARVMKSWGVIFPWNANFTFNASGKSSNDVLSIAKEVLVSGGQLQGLMEGRPGLRHFGYGQFDVTKWEVKDVGDTVLDKVEIGEEEEAASA